MPLNISDNRVFDVELIPLRDGILREVSILFRYELFA